jgi:hypothetical protein
MTIGTADLGGMGNGLGLPIANPLYGPATAAVMGQQAWNQNMQNAQATTAETRARTNRDIQTLQPDIAFKNAQTSLTTQQAASAQIENDAKNVLGPQRIAQGIDADIMSKSTEAQQRSHDYLQRQIIQNADILDNKSPQEASQILEGWGQQAGLKPGEASGIYGGLSAKYAPPPPNAGPGNAGNANVPQVGGYAALRKSLLEANPDIFKERLSQEGQTQRNAATLSTEQKIAQQKIDAELQMKGIEESSNPQTAYQYLQNKSVEALNAGNQDLADQYKKRADQAYDHAKEMQVAQAAAHNAYGVNLPSLGISNNAGVKPGETPATPQAPPVGTDLGGGAKLIAAPGAQAPSPAGNGIQPVPSGPGGQPPQAPPSQPTPGGMPAGANPANVGGMPGAPVDQRLKILQDELQQATDPADKAALSRSIQRIQQQAGGQPSAPAAPAPQPAAPPNPYAPPQRGDTQQYNAEIERNQSRQRDMMEDHQVAQQLGSNPNITKAQLQGEIQKVSAFVGQTKDPQEKYQLMRILTRLSMAQQYVKA